MERIFDEERYKGRPQNRRENSVGKDPIKLLGSEELEVGCSLEEET